MIAQAEILIRYSWVWCVPDHRIMAPVLAEGYLLVYSATDEVSDGDLVFNPHSSYLIYTPDGKRFKSVENHMSRGDEIPERVSLPAGSYIVEARSANNGYLRVPVVIKPSRQTVLDLDDESKTFSGSVAEKILE